MGILGDILSKETTNVPESSGILPGYDIRKNMDSEHRIEHLEYIIQSSDLIVHDMNNQLAAIVAMSDLLIRTAKDENAVSDGLQRILNSAREMSGLATRWQDLLRGDMTNTSQPAFDKNGVSTQLRLREKGANGQQRSTGERSPVERSSTNKPRHVLLIDDEEVVCSATEEMLRRIHYKVTSFYSGKDGIAFYREHTDQIGLVILDMMMPEMDGYQVFSELMKINPDVDVLVASGYSHNDAAQKLLSAGARGFIQKPFRIRELSQTVNAILPIPEQSVQNS